MTCLCPVDLIAHPFSTVVTASMPQILLFGSELRLTKMKQNKTIGRKGIEHLSHLNTFFFLGPLTEYLVHIFLRLSFCYHLSPFCCLSHPLLLQHHLSFGFPNSHLADLGNICIFYSGSLHSTSFFYIVLLCIEVIQVSCSFISVLYHIS